MGFCSASRYPCILLTLGPTPCSAPVDLKMDELQTVPQRMTNARFPDRHFPPPQEHCTLPCPPELLSPGMDAMASPRRRSSRTLQAQRIRMKLRAVSLMHKTWHGDSGTAGPRQLPAASSRRPAAWPGAAAGLSGGEQAVPGGPGDGQPLGPWTCPRACTGCGRGCGDVGPGGGSAVSVASHPSRHRPPFPLLCPCPLWLAPIPQRASTQRVPHGPPRALRCLRAWRKGRDTAMAVCPLQP